MGLEGCCYLDMLQAAASYGLRLLFNLFHRQFESPPDQGDDYGDPAKYDSATENVIPDRWEKHQHKEDDDNRPPGVVKKKSFPVVADSSPVHETSYRFPVFPLRD